MKSANGNSPDITNLKPCDYQAFVEALGARSSPTDALRIAFVWMPLGMQGHFEPLNM